MKKLIVLGGGESGVGSAILAKQQGFDVFLSDKGNLKEEYKNTLIKENISFEETSHDENRILKADIIIKSPGISKKNELIKKIKEKGIELISEIEFASRYTSATLIAITGSNGKTTTTSLTYHTLKEAGLNVGLAGNIGKSFAWQVATENFDYYVLEISSFQLDDCYSFKPKIAMLLNLSPDHLDEYEYDYNKYANSKFRIAQAQDENDFFIVNADDEKIQELYQNHQIKSKKITFSIKNNPESDAYINTNELVINTETIFKMEINKIGIQGPHNYANAAAAGLASKLINVKNEKIQKSFESFEGVVHRLEKVAKIEGVQYINDSKATNVNSVYYALSSIKSQIILILGGVDKGNDYAELFNLVEDKVKAIVCLGKDNSIIIDNFSDKVQTIVETSSMKDCVQACYALAESGDTVLLSPANASFDLFKNFEDRGEQFVKEVKNLI
jgi:UDP-N-acetylmuramoylalanine--D-glutamate ligase